MQKNVAKKYIICTALLIMACLPLSFIIFGTAIDGETINVAKIISKAVGKTGTESFNIVRLVLSILIIAVVVVVALIPLFVSVKAFCGNYFNLKKKRLFIEIYTMIICVVSLGIYLIDYTDTSIANASIPFELIIAISLCIFIRIIDKNLEDPYFVEEVKTNEGIIEQVTSVTKSKPKKENIPHYNAKEEKRIATIMKYKDLFDQGFITEVEFKKIKKELMPKDNSGRKS